MIAVDTSVLADWLGSGPRTEGAADALRAALHQGPVVLCDVVLAELCAGISEGAQLLQHLEEAGLRYLPTEARAALRAGEMQRRWRQRGGRAEPRPMSDFIVGAHALLQCAGLITYDDLFYRDYFKGLKVIVPQG